MTNDEFESLVRKLEDQARRDPAGYQFRVLLLALLGNTYLGAMLLLIAGLLAALVASVTVLKAIAIKLIFVVGVFLWLVLKAVWVRIPPPEGTEVLPSESAELFAMIEALRRDLGAPRFHRVLVTDDFNAGVVQAPQLGIFGMHRNYLLIGLPLMKALTVDQFKAVLAHEFGHLARGHGRISNWIYRQRLRWGRLMASLEASQSAGSFLFRPFLNWYAPYFNAYSFPLARINEYQADATSARLTSPRAAAEALTGVDVVGRYLGERFWPQIHKQAGEQPQPAGFMPYAFMGERFTSDLDEASAKTWMDRAMARQTTSADTHPALPDRLKAIGESPRLAPPAPGQAADQLLGRDLARITDAFDRRWQERILPFWQERHREVQEGRRRLAELDARHHACGELAPQEAFDRAQLTDSVGDNADAAFEQFRALYERDKDNAVFCYSLGVRLLTRNDAAGCALVERAMQLDESATLSACAALRDYCQRAGREAEARAWQQRMAERAELQDGAEKERSRVHIKDKLLPHDLPDDALERLRAQLQAVSGLRKAYFVRKQVAHLPQRTCYLLGYTVTGAFRMHNKQRAAEVLGRIRETVRFPGETLILNAEGEFSGFKRKFASVKGARLQ